MGFYGNITYNTYGLQNESVKPEHLDRPYWQYITSNEVVGIQGLRQFLGLETVNNDEEGQKQWEEKWAIAEQRIYKFYLPAVSENTTLRKLLGNGMLLGWVRYINDTYSLYILSLGSRTGQIFRYTINPYKNDELPSDLLYDEWDTEHTQAIDWLLRKTIVTSQIKDQNITTNKIAAEAVTTAKIDNEAVTTEKIANKDVTPSKLDRDYWERTVWSSIDSYTDLFQKCTAIPANGTISDTDYNKGTLYIVKLLQLSLPIIYTDSDNKSTFLIESNEKYNFGQCFVQNNDNIITVMSGTTGQVWTIERVTVSSEETIAENGIYYKPILKQISTPQVADRSISTIKIAPLAVKGGTDSTSIIDGYTVTSYNIESYTITGEADENHCNIAEKTITAYNIADETITNEQIALSTITQDNLKDVYARCYIGQGEPESGSGYVYNENAQIGDLYIDSLTGYVYCHKGYYQNGHEWISTQQGPISYLKGEKTTQWPTQANIGDIWVNENTGAIYIYRKISDNFYKWDPLHSYNTFSNGQIQFISNTPKGDQTGTYTFIYELLQSQVLDTTTYLFVGDNTSENDAISYDILSDHPNELYVGIIEENPSVNPETSHYFICTNVITGEKTKFYMLHEMVGNGIWGYYLRHENYQANQATVSFELPTNPTIGTLYYRSETSSLQVYTDSGWKDIEGYSSSPLISNTLEEIEE